MRPWRALDAIGLTAALALAACAPAPRAAGQQDGGAVQSPQRTAILELPELGPAPGGIAPALGPAPGTLSTTFDGGAGTAGSGVLGGKKRTGRIPRSRPGTAAVPAALEVGAGPPEALPTPSGEPGPSTGADLADAALIFAAGPADGLSLDAAIERLLAANLDIRALRQELAQADADVLTAGLRTNPLVYMDSQFIPYGSFTDQTPGGPTQYDVNITYPLDVSRKRQARIVVARMARSTVEAQFQDVVRRQIAAVSRAFVTLQAARIELAIAEAAVERRQREWARIGPGERTAAARERVAAEIERGRDVVAEARQTFADAQDALAVLLAIPPAEAAALEPGGSIRDAAPAPPPAEDLTALALRCRPDVHAARQGVTRAGAEVALQRANRFDDVYLFYDPITIQDNRPIGRPDSRSWAMGLTFALPIYNRNQGNIAKAESNVSQTKLELSALERRVVAEVRLARREYDRSLEAFERLERVVLPRVRGEVARAAANDAAGRGSAEDREATLAAAADTVDALREAAIRHRRAMVELNGAVGLRILP